MLLRPYQEDAVQKIRRAFASGSRSVLYQLPTGAGKTLVFSYIAREAEAKGNSIAILVHRRELLLQGSRALTELEVPHGIVAPGFPKVGMQTQIASVQTLVRRAHKMREPSLVICDEAHHASASTYRKIRDAWRRARWLGVTATPSRTDGVGLNEDFDILITGPSMKVLVEGGYLVPTEVYAPPLKADLSGIHTVAGDFDRHEVEVRMDRPQITGDAVDHYKRLGGGGRAIAFCATLKHAAHVTEAFTESGIVAEQIDGTLEPDERDAMVRRFGNGSTRVLVSCAIVEEGFDCPAAEVAILLRPTESVRVFLQQIGRVMRPSPGKTRAVVLDHVGNSERLGLPDADRTWTLEGRKRKKGDRVPPMSRCLKCFACFPPADVCPVCGAVMEKREKPGIAEVEGELTLVKGVTDIQERMRFQRQEEGMCQSMADFVDLGRRRGYANPRGWAWHRWNARLRKRPSLAGSS